MAPENRNYSRSNQPQQTEPVSGGHVACGVANLTPFLSGVLVSSLHPDPGRVFSCDADLLAVQRSCRPSKLQAIFPGKRS